MRKVIKVCEDAVRSELPSFDGMMAFSVFNLKEDVGCPTSSVLQDMIPGKKHYPETCDSLERLSLIFQVSRDKLIAEYEYLQIPVWWSWLKRGELYLKKLASCNCYLTLVPMVFSQAPDSIISEK